MPGKDKRAADAAASALTQTLRQLAEARSEEKSPQLQDDWEALSPETTRQMLHELRVHKIELEMQNEELRLSQIALDAARLRYFDLYDLAPVGYCTVSEKGLILQANLTAATLLGVTRGMLLKQPLSRFICKEDQDHYYRMRKQLIAGDELESCELQMVKHDGSKFWVHLLSTLVQDSSAGSGRAASTGSGQGSGDVPALRVVIDDITERRRAEQQLRELSTHLQCVREEEKASFAREIHDELGGTLAALKMDASWLVGKLPEDAEMLPLRNCVNSMIGLLDAAVIAMRRIITDLRPTLLDDLGLMATLEWYAAQFHLRTCIECRVVCARRSECTSKFCSECAFKLDKMVSINLYRIFQESLTNVMRHSGASRVDVEYYIGNHEAILSVSDNGCGLPQGHVIAPTSFGMLGMRERVEQLGGQITVDSQPGCGLTVTVKLPLSAAK